MIRATIYLLFAATINFLILCLILQLLSGEISFTESYKAVSQVILNGGIL